MLRFVTILSVANMYGSIHGVYLDIKSVVYMNNLFKSNLVKENMT